MKKKNIRIAAASLAALMTVSAMAVSASAQWVESRGKTVWADSAGVIQKNTWINTSAGKYYLQGDGTATTGFAYIEKYGISDLYYFNSNGVMQTGWQLINNKYYYFLSSGEAVTGMKMKIGKYSFIFNESGVWSGRVYDGTADVTLSVNIEKITGIASSSSASTLQSIYDEFKTIQSIYNGYKNDVLAYANDSDKRTFEGCYNTAKNVYDSAKIGGISEKKIASALSNMYSYADKMIVIGEKSVNAALITASVSDTETYNNNIDYINKIADYYFANVSLVESNASQTYQNDFNDCYSSALGVKTKLRSGNYTSETLKKTYQQLQAIYQRMVSIYNVAYTNYLNAPNAYNSTIAASGINVVTYTNTVPSTANYTNPSIPTYQAVDTSAVETKLAKYVNTFEGYKTFVKSYGTDSEISYYSYYFDQLVYLLDELTCSSITSAELNQITEEMDGYSQSLSDIVEAITNR